MDEDIFSLPFDQYQRYYALRKCVELIKESEGISCLNLIDVGGHPGVLIDFLASDTVTIVDNQPCERPNYVQADACALPFEDAVFDVATTIDVFEHIPVAKRPAFLEELFRVSKEYVILAAPFSSKAVIAAEELLFEFVKKTMGEDFAKVHPLREHIEHGLPSQDLLQQTIERENSAHINVSQWPAVQLADSEFDKALHFFQFRTARTWKRCSTVSITNTWSCMTRVSQVIVRSLSYPKAASRLFWTKSRRSSILLNLSQAPVNWGLPPDCRCLSFFLHCFRPELICY